MMNKRELRKHLDPHLKFNPNNGLLYAEKYSYVVRTAVKNIDGRRTLLLYFYPIEHINKGEFIPQYTVFQTRKEYLTLERLPDGKAKWRTAILDNISCEYNNTLAHKSAFYTRRDGTRVCQFCRSETADGFSALRRLQYKLLQEKCHRNHVIREREIRKRMKPIGKIPAAFQKWVENEVIPAHIFYDYRKCKIQLGYCIGCRKTVTISDARHNKQGVCPSCGKSVTFHAIGRKSHVYDRLTVQMLQKVGNELVLRIFKTGVNYEDYRSPSSYFMESSRDFIPIDGAGNFDSYYYGNTVAGITSWRNGFRPVINRLAENYMASSCGYLYTKNLKEVLQGTAWQYSQLYEFCNHFQEPMEVSPYLRQYIRHPELEYLVKFRLYHLASDEVYNHYGSTLKSGHSFSEILDVPKEALPLMQAIDIGTKGLRILHDFFKQGIALQKELLVWCLEKGISDMNGLHFCLQYISPHKLIRYIGEQNDRLNRFRAPNGSHPFERHAGIFSQYKDYLRFCVDLEYNMRDDFILYPKNLKEAHDRASDMLDRRKAAVYNQGIASAYADLAKRFEMKKFGMMIVPPKSAEQIVQEGQELHHCVGGYLPRIVKKECIILFLRKTKEPDKPFYTVEVQNGEVVQIRGESNCNPSEKVKQYMQIWEQEKLKAASAAA